MPPPPLMAPAVIGDHAQFMKILSSLDQQQPPPPTADADEAGAPRLQSARRRISEMLSNLDSQGNNTLHAVCASPPSSDGIAILKEIISTISSSAGDGLASQSPAQLLSLVSSFNAKNQIGCTPVWLCCGYGNVKLLSAMFDAIALHAGTREGERRRLVRDLLSSTNTGGDSAILAACSRGHTDTLAFIVDMLKKSEGGEKDVNSSATTIQQILTQPNKAGSTPLFAAVGSSNSKCVDLLLSMLGGRSGGETTHDHLLAKNRLGLTLLHIACERDSGETVMSLLAPLASSSTTPVPILTMLLSSRDANNATPLMLASFLGNLSALAALRGPTLAATSSGSGEENLLDATDGGGRTAYYLAKAASKDEAAALLARNVGDGGFGANVDIRDSSNISAEEAGERSKKAKEERDRKREEERAARA